MEACRICGNQLMPARDERIFCEAEQAWSQGKQGDRRSEKRSKNCVGHGEKSAVLVPAILFAIQIAPF
jgi:hypothetical protein